MLFQSQLNVSTLLPRLALIHGCDALCSPGGQAARREVGTIVQFLRPPEHAPTNLSADPALISQHLR
jgi:hypothetical protein